MTAIKEWPDKFVLYGTVEWRCHQCKALAEREQLHWHGELLLCDECLKSLFKGEQSGS
jgi:hypothetical protein